MTQVVTPKFGFSKENKMKPFFHKQKDETDPEEDYNLADDIDPPVIESKKQVKPASTTNGKDQTKKEDESHIIKIQAYHTNAYKLGELFGIDSLEILKKIQTVSKEFITDEFQDLPKDLIETLALEYGKEIELIEDPAEMKNFKVRPPVVTIMGHVDHGKTTLLDAFRHSQKVKEEYGDITQSIGAFTFVTDSQHEVTFIDTPGHEAFQNLRVRGAKVTDMIILVISAIESVQPQTVEVINLAQQLDIPIIVAINKIDRDAADPESVMLDLASHNLVPEELGGDIVCVPISAKMKTNLDILEQKIIDVAQDKLNLHVDFGGKAQCFVIESNFDEKSTQITATVLIKKGTLKQEDIFVCGPHEGKVRYMKNDQGKNVKVAYPGQAVHIAGFRSFPEVGSPLYACQSHEEAMFISNRIKVRRELELNKQIQDKSQPMNDLKKKMKGLSRMEKRKLYSGDKTIMYEKMGLIEESDIEKYRKKLGLKKGVDLIGKNIEEIEELLADQAGEDQMKGKKNAFRKQRLLDFDREELKKILIEFKEEQKKLDEMDPLERERYEQERLKIKEVYRDEDVKHFPIILKASSAGTLETLLQEAEKVVGTNNYRISIIDYSVGPVTEGDMSNAQQTGAVIFSFDVPCAPMVTKSAESQGVIIRQHKTIYKFLEDIDNFVYDAKAIIAEESGKHQHVEVIGSAKVAQIFKIKEAQNRGPHKTISVAGCRVSGGDIERKHKYRIMRGDRVIQDNLKLHSMKKLQQDVTLVEKGHECGLAFENFEGDLMPGDVIEAYKEIEGKVTKFNHKPGVHQSF